MRRAKSVADDVFTAAYYDLRDLGFSPRITAEWDVVSGTPHLRVWIYARDFEPYEYTHRQDIVWRAATHEVPRVDLIRVSAIMTLTPTEKKRFF